MATTEAAKICGLCKEVTLAILPRLHQEELLLELGRRNILVGETYKKESLVSKLWFLMIKEFQGTDRCVIPDPPMAVSGTSCSSATEQRNMRVTLSNDLQDLMETVTLTNCATNIVPVKGTSNNNADLHVSLTQSNGSYSTPVTSPTRSTNLTATQPSTSVTMSSPQRLPILAQEVIVETTTVTSPRKSARLHTLETQASSSSVRNLQNIDNEAVETLEESTATKEGLGKGYLKRELRAVTVTRQSCSVVTELGAMRELVDEDGDDPNAEEDEEEDGVSSDEDDAPLEDDDDPDWQPDSPVEDRQPHSGDIPVEANVSGKDSSSGLAGPSEEVVTDSHGQKKAHPQEPMKLHSPEQGYYKCKECDVSFKYSSQRSTHMKQVHSPPGSSGALCEQCGYKAPTQHALKLHIYKHTGERPYKCTLCAFSARKPSIVKRHVTISHPGKNSYKCAYCSHFAETKSLLRKHEDAHKTEHVHKCPVRSCPISSNDRNELIAHLARSHKKSQQYSCPECDHKTYLLRELKEHMKTFGHEKTYKCDKCEFSAKTYPSLRSHRRGHNANKKYKCDKCGFSSAFKAVVLNHTNKVHGDNAFQCPHCEFNADTQDDLSIHLGKHSNRITCDMCGYIAKTKERLEQHIEEHSTANKLFGCTTHGCNFLTPDQQCLVRHLTSHELGRPFPCEHCDYRAKKKEVLAVHMRLHTGEKPLKCTKCSYSTSLGHMLRKHEARHEQGLI
ncbi:putative zinc finger protein 66 [Branchiostoma floridae]|uniref:Zinc finger protein 66 n=1 Tax=Branchiostoma floridae TaxID=7739 RepID=A0A9J7HPM1_BRAFL|nr:putative zinc finger protein 66 [Branchiostoma floridae]